MEALIFMELYHLIEIFGWGNLTSPWLDGECVVAWWSSSCACLADHPLVALFMDVGHIISLWWFGIYAYLGYG
jgi:hypothetical protein